MTNAPHESSISEVHTGFLRRTRHFLHVPTGAVSTRILDLPRSGTIDQVGLRSFLHFGYIPGFRTLFEDIVCLPGGANVEVWPGGYRVVSQEQLTDFVVKTYQTASRPELVDLGVRKWRQTISTLYSARGSRQVVVPLSGGLDSRAVLAGLLENSEASKIKTFTFGAPGSLDFEIGCEVAKRVGTDHIAYDLSGYEYGLERMLKVADRHECSTTLLDHVPFELVERDFPPGKCDFWSGFFLDLAAGYEAPETPNQPTYPEIGALLLEKHRLVRPVRMESCLASPSELRVELPELPARCRRSMGVSELWNIVNRQERYIANVVLPRGLEFVSPALDREWLSFILSVPADWRHHQELYFDIMLHAYRDLFSIRSKTTHGRSPAERHNPSTSLIPCRVRRLWDRLFPEMRRNRKAKYVNFCEGFRHRSDLRSLAIFCIERLCRRNEFDPRIIQSLWDRHVSGGEDLSSAIAVLVGLELCLRTAESR